jgi:Flp pilus assembly protein TadD
VQRDDLADRLLREIKETNSRKFSAAQLHLAGLVKMYKSDPDLLFALGGFFNRQEDWEEATPVFYGAGISYTHLNRVDEAIAAYRQARNLAPDDLRIRQNLGAAYCNSGRSEEAVAEFQKLHRA